jgi:hypothetical protein
MSIIVILIGLLVPALNKARIYAFKVRQKVQIRNIETGLRLFEAEIDSIPDSDAEDISPAGEPYCGAMKLAEAMLGQDLLGFHPDSLFRRDGLADVDGDGVIGNHLLDDLYPAFSDPPDPDDKENMKRRKGPFVALENANGYYMDDIYTDLGIFAGGSNVPVVMCDVYKKVTHIRTGQNIGMPILFYRADTSKNSHVFPDPTDDNIYDYLDNDDLVLLGMPWSDGTAGPAHPQASSGTTRTGKTATAEVFYEITRNKKVTITDRPYNEDSYIIQSAGYDGEYGTSDDVFNFGN